MSGSRSRKVMSTSCLLLLLALTIVSFLGYACYGRAYVGGNWPWHHYHHSKTIRTPQITSRDNRPCLMLHSSTRPPPLSLLLLHPLHRARSRPISALSCPTL